MTGLAAFQRDFMAMLEAQRPPEDPRLALYHHNTRANRIAAMADAFPVVRRLVGEAFFDEAAIACGRAHPSRSGDLNRCGSDFPAFLATYRPAAALDYLPDVARLEWALHESYYAADAAGFDFEALSRVPAHRHGELRLRLHPAARLIDSPHPIVAIWEANQPGRDGTPDAQGGAGPVLVHRPDEGPRPERLSLLAWRFLESLARGCTLGETCEALGDGASQLGALVTRFATSGVICGFDLRG